MQTTTKELVTFLLRKTAMLQRLSLY